jgi:hypothetical protein
MAEDKEKFLAFCSEIGITVKPIDAVYAEDDFYIYYIKNEAESLYLLLTKGYKTHNKECLIIYC